MRNYLGFGDFLFRMPDGKVISRAHDLNSLVEEIQTVPDESLLYHAGRNDFSTWLLARTEFDLARRLQPQRVDDFESASALRAHLLLWLTEFRERARAGVVAEFTSETFDASNMFVRIGAGSLGGKGRGLAFMNALLETYKIDNSVKNARIFVPPTMVLATGIFDRFMENPELAKLAFGDVADLEVARAFVKAVLPEDVVEKLRAFLELVHYPLAIRSSSLLEDASLQPFAGVYRTYMLPNNNESLETRLNELMTAIKLVYASTYYADAKGYLESTPNRLEEEKMAVVIQHMVGRRHGDYLYPNFSGTARSRNFYPVEGMTPEGGVAAVALGLGAMVVEGGRCVRFSPANPRKPIHFSTVEESLKNSQREFYALDLSKSAIETDFENKRQPNLIMLGLDAAELHGTLGPVGSVYSPDNDAIYEGVSRPGVRLVSMAGILKGGLFPLAEVLSFLLKVGEGGFSGPVEMEFAVNLRMGQEVLPEFGFLQIRPLAFSAEIREQNLDLVVQKQAICITRRALGHGLLEGISDIVYVRRDNFDRSRTMEIAQEIGTINARLKQAERPYLLIGQGRWGSADKWLGIPVTWAQISGVKCIIETDLIDIRVEPSQGSHFFQNIMSLGIGYFTVNFSDSGTVLDYDWLDKEPAKFETTHVRHLFFEQGLEIAVDSRKGMGVVMKPGFKVRKENPYSD